MSFCKITAIIQPDRVSFVEDKMKELNIGGFNKITVTGLGEYRNYYVDDAESEHTHIELYLHESRITEIVEGIMEAAHTGSEGDGIVVTSPVNDVYRIRTKEKCLHDEIC